MIPQDYRNMVKAFTPETLAAMRDWVSECAVDEEDAEDIAEAEDWQIVKYICRQYDGGLENFLACL